MPLGPGAKLGPYQVLAPTGAGGMGEVYRARETRLGGDIAIKLLPAEVAQDRERLARFRREARGSPRRGHPRFISTSRALGGWLGVRPRPAARLDVVVVGHVRSQAEARQVL
jgi:eukaryotic-like serine/threonine-protein kinase